MPEREVGQRVELDTPHGPARAHLELAARPVAALVLGHGAGGGVRAPDLLAASEAARSLRISVALVEQPYVLAGRRSQPPPRQLDEAWVAVVQALRAGPLGSLALLIGGRSAGARVACRTAGELEPAGVLCLAFPLHPPGRGDDPAKSRLGELDAVRVPTLVVQGERDPFGMPPPGPRRRVVRVAGTHSLRSGAAVGDAVRAWLGELTGRSGVRSAG
ncbi:MAG TPA: alpha/beta family hydrolase [Solirubrobacteraceae bacterium]|nr:alpha/beta family hydrolase [Solirubrobacteraceae bacterium]